MIKSESEKQHEHKKQEQKTIEALGVKVNNTKNENEE
jgi:hypothetical protein